MDEKYDALCRNHMWDLVPRPVQQPVTCKWLFCIKRNPDGSIARYKARPVARGFMQQLGRDYYDAFSPVTKPDTIRIIMSIALARDWSLRQLDVNNAFLHGTLAEEVYMIQPPGYIDHQHSTHVCRLRKAIYGLKQAPRAWYLELSWFLLSAGFRRSKADASLFIYSHDNTHIYFLVYVDDIVLTGNDNRALELFISKLTRRFSVKDLGPLHHFLGVEVIPHSDGLFLTQRQYTLHILETCKMSEAKGVMTPMTSTVTISSDDNGVSVDVTQYQQALGLLRYLAFTRPDISFAVNKLSQYMQRPTQNHWQAVKRILRYLKSTLNFGLVLR
ncbi:unnamed protein product [Cuscuta europaea]|uniref:Reverse transcriptase Ty1/copia-type domain-containing protein n=1 Tax=Cuscuta europaea TaxID=41803 RepID=A0A9P0ZQ88_CUSEU|nr:unnamed protein product [Cuscuta europaea]